jgi:hypothetical protein
MVLAWSQDRVGPITRTIEDAAMVFNTIHGVDPNDNSTVTTPFHFDRNIKVASMRIGVDDAAPKEFVDGLRELGANLKPIGPRPQMAGGGLGVESSAAFDSYVQMKAKELNIDVASIPEPVGRGGGGGGGGGRGRGAADTTAAGRGGPPTAAIGGGGAGGGAGGGGGGRGGDPGNPTGMAAITRWTGGRFARGFDFINSQRRRFILISQMAELLKDFDMYVPGQGGDVGLHAQTGHPCAVVPYKFDSPAAGRGGRGADTTTPPVTYNPQPICTVLAGNLYNDDKILSVAHQYQIHHDWHTRHPKI